VVRGPARPLAVPARLGNGVNQSCRYEGQSRTTRCRLDTSQGKDRVYEMGGAITAGCRCFSQRPMWERSTLMYQYKSPVVIGHVQYASALRCLISHGAKKCTVNTTEPFTMTINTDLSHGRRARTDATMRAELKIATGRLRGGKILRACIGGSNPPISVRRGELQAGDPGQERVR